MVKVKKISILVAMVLFSVCIFGFLYQYGHYLFTDVVRISTSVHHPIPLRKPTLQDVPPPCDSVSWEVLKYVRGYPDGNLTNGEYYLEVATDGTFDNIVKASGWYSGLSYTVNALPDDDTYYYRIKARDSTNFTEVSLWSDTKMCSTSAEEIPEPEVSPIAATGGGIIRGGGKRVKPRPEPEPEPEIEIVDIADHWAKDFIEELYSQGVVSGYDETRYGPDNFMTRAELTKIAVNMSNIEVPEASERGESSFKDVSVSQWYAPFIETAYEHEIILGYSDGTFKPNNYINRAEAIKILLEAAGAIVEDINYDVQFPDVSADAWYADYINYAAKYEIVNGYQDGTFGPDSNLTRGEAAKIALNVFTKLQKP